MCPISIKPKIPSGLLHASVLSYHWAIPVRTKVIFESLPHSRLILVPLGSVDMLVPCLQSPLGALVRFLVGHLVYSQTEHRYRVAVQHLSQNQLWRSRWETWTDFEPAVNGGHGLLGRHFEDDGMGGCTE
jgi:hypothetical protein